MPSGVTATLTNVPDGLHLISARAFNHRPAGKNVVSDDRVSGAIGRGGSGRGQRRDEDARRPLIAQALRLRGVEAKG